MTIYIYGSKSFKNNIHEVLEHANIKFRLGEEDSIVELNSLHKLKGAIEKNPKNIFLIDDEKIIKRNSLNEKIKFLKPKDGIEEEFLKEHGIGDLRVDDIENIATKVIRKLERAQDQREANSSVSNENEALSKDIQNKEELNTTFDFKNDEQVFKEEITFTSIENENLEKEDFEITIEKTKKKEEDDMADEFSELDNLKEDELLDALGSPNAVNNDKQNNEQSGAKVELDSGNINEISTLINQLLNNKTLEITIKIKE